MPRYRIDIEYDGTPFVGWQMQADGVSVQGRLSEAILRFCGESVRVRGAGRTDAGVHALGQVAHFDLEREWPPATVRAAINFHLKPDPIVVRESACVEPTFDARMSALARHYRYRILNRAAPSALDRDRLWWVPQALDRDAMADAAAVLLGRHDFTTFRAASCQAASPVKTLDRLAVLRQADEIHIEASARSFLQHQVRSMVGCLKVVGQGKWTSGDLRRALAVQDRTACAALAPPRGLYLVRVDY